MTVDPAIRRANRWLFIALVIFAIGLCAGCLLWMRYRTAKEGGRVFPPSAASPASAQASQDLSLSFVRNPFSISFQFL